MAVGETRTVVREDEEEWKRTRMEGTSGERGKKKKDEETKGAKGGERGRRVWEESKCDGRRKRSERGEGAE